MSLRSCAVLALALSSARADTDDKYGSTQNLGADPIGAAARAARAAASEATAPDKSAYPPPADWIYNTSAAIVPGKLNVHVVPHSHKQNRKHSVDAHQECVLMEPKTFRL